eukprot:TRINITY_DN26892_c0_g1_i1.p1 TRINITY_DN26892_c0_g1~~TRINITY_DN26892_c0_g1_i1.p1  ORF type:complete len:155 (-),score=42.80 TRINITY_DN26892_c0_g1_i1:263-727(-)
MKRRLAERKASDAVDELAKAVCNPKSTVDALIQAAKKDVAEAEMTTAVNRFAKAIGKSVSEVVGLIESVWTDVAQKGYEFSMAMKRRLAESVSEVVGLIESVQTDVSQKGNKSETCLFFEEMSERVAEGKASGAVDEQKGERRSRRIGQGRLQP